MTGGLVVVVTMVMTVVVVRQMRDPAWDMGGLGLDYRYFTPSQVIVRGTGLVAHRPLPAASPRRPGEGGRGKERRCVSGACGKDI